METTKIAEIKKSLEIGDYEQEILREIGYCYHNMYAPDLDKAYKYLQDLGIRKIEVDDDVIYICLERPGIFIGEKGSNIEAIEKHLKENGINEKIHLIEVTRPPIDLLTAWQYGYEY